MEFAIIITIAYYNNHRARRTVLNIQSTGKSIQFECHMTAPEIWSILTVGSDPRGYFLGGFNLFKLANKKLFGFFHLYYIDQLLVYGKNLYVYQLLFCSIDVV